MKKYKQLIVGFILGALTFSVVPVGAAIEEFLCYRADYKVMVNGSEYTSDELPLLNYKGNTYAPFRSILEKAGLDVNWNAELNQAEVKSSPASAQNINLESDNMITESTINPKKTLDGINIMYFKDGQMVFDGSGTGYLSIYNIRKNFPSIQYQTINENTLKLINSNDNSVIMDNISYIKVSNDMLIESENYNLNIYPIIKGLK